MHHARLPPCDAMWIQQTRSNFLVLWGKYGGIALLGKGVPYSIPGYSLTIYLLPLYALRVFQWWCWACQGCTLCTAKGDMYLTPRWGLRCDVPSACCLLFGRRVDST